MNPLLRGPGLLVVMMASFAGTTRAESRRLARAAKPPTTAAIGKFGFGQKAVFHLCDAFIVYARREDGEAFSTVVNPFLDVDVEGNISRQWEPAGLDPADVGFLAR